MTYNRFAAWQQKPAPDAVVTFAGAASGVAITSPGGESTSDLQLTPVTIPGTFGSASLSAQITVNAAGQVTGVEEVTIVSVGLANAVTLAYTGDVTGSSPFDGKGDVSTALTLATVNGNVGTFGDSTHVAQVTLDAKGRTTAASSVAIAFPAAPVSSFNSRTGAITLTSGDVTTALGYVPPTAVFAPPTQKITPSSGFSQVIADGVNRLLIVPSGTLTTGSVTMPANPVDNQEVTVASTQIITTLSVNGNSGQTVDGALTTISANSFGTWHWRAGDSTWFRVG